MFSALIHPDGRLTTLSGVLNTDAVSIAALAHAVHAAGNELAIRIGTQAQSVTLSGPVSSLTLLPMAQGVMILEHDRNEAVASLQMRAAGLLAQMATPAPIPPVATAPMSLADALYATAP